ncbi:YgiQ family radical SAM protein [Leadbettera azotonutricia]|uniref:Radical SAM N-domain protein n=1 Tax=Leadbettera azotonutricia (strain ATCC BAA-888 / DSM 13862 / ZAS-9) TaxID=545695 RepID=F5Y830_LEAAZ|nr:YgiQ family radical SAM protein [Leadbettera azotonutricia]AEF81981.1 radical SAM N- domain protein [Leadbettera azotonutricia ZAS-9]
MADNGFLPLSRADLEARGWEACDFVFVSGDAYVDHPSFAASLICRVLEADGFRVGIIPQPDWKNPQSYTVLGRPRLAFLAGSGNMDSMVAHYTAAKKIRSDDAYSPGGKAGLRPDRALLKYVEGIRSAYKNIPVIIGGIEAGLRRFAHYDYWSNTVRRSLLLDSKADILVYGMGESAIREIARRLKGGEEINAIGDIRGTCVRGRTPPEGSIELPGYEKVKGDDPESLRAYAGHFMIQKLNADPLSAGVLAEKSDGERWVIQNPPAFPLGQKELDRVYSLPFARKAHPVYAGGIPALKEVEFSLISSRGCFGGCSFCAITFHQGRAVQPRSSESLVREAAALAKSPDFKGYIHDVGGPTANFYAPACKKQQKGGFCADRECLFPEPCPNLKQDHGPYLETLQQIRGVKGVKKAFVRSGIRFDYIDLDKKRGEEFLETLCKYHISGQLKVAPEHIAPQTLNAMGKNHDYEGFSRKFARVNKELGLKQYLIPYFISGHPGCTLKDAVELAIFLKKGHFVPDQVQDFYPTPGTLSTVMYHTGLDPRTMAPIHVPGEREKRLQRALLQFNKAENRLLALEALREAGHEDLAGALLK